MCFDITDMSTNTPNMENDNLQISRMADFSCVFVLKQTVLDIARPSANRDNLANHKGVRWIS